MSKWHSFLEYIQFPLKVLFFATVLLGIGTLISNPYLGILETFDFEILSIISNALKYIGGFVIKLFPLLVFLKVLTRKYEDSAPVFIGFFSLIIITVIMMVLVEGNYPSYFYTNTLGIQIEMKTVENVIINLKSPYNTGILTLIISYLITSYAYRKSRHHIRNGILYFIDHDTWGVVIAFALSVVAGVILSFVWPLIIELMQLFFNYVADDIYDIGRMFFYGIFERISAVLNMEEIPRSIFWLNEAGGSAVDFNGNTYFGDVGLWNAFLYDASSVLKTGHFTGAYYIINMAIMPAYIFGYYSLIEKGENRGKYKFFIILAIVTSIIIGNPLPMEYLMLILSPLLFIAYLLLVGTAFVIVSLIGSVPGYFLTGPLFTAMPGNILDLLLNMKHVTLFYGSINLLVACIPFAILFYFITINYFRKAAIGFLSMHDVKVIAKDIKEAMGGLDNILDIVCTPDKMVVSFVNRDIVDLIKLNELGAYLILESKEGYTIRLGNMNVMIAQEIKKELISKKVEQE